MKTRLVLEISGGLLTQVWSNDSDVEVVLIDHDNATISEEAKPASLIGFPIHDYLIYDGGYPRDWGRTREELMQTCLEVKS